MMQKDEDTLLLPWVLYHGALFGFESLFVFDNGSVDPAVIAGLEVAAGLGVTVDRRFDQKLDFVRKGEVLGAQMRALRDAGGWDLFLPLDCDEFLALQDGEGVCFERERILAGLAALVADDRVPYVIMAYMNVLGTIDRFRPESCLKTFVQARGFVELDHGFHQVRSSLSETPVDSGFVYIHCHGKPFARVVRDAREKLAYWCDVDSPAAADELEATNGAGWHLVKYLRMTEREYLATFGHEGSVSLPGFAERLAAVGADTGFLLGGETRRQGNGVMVFGAQGPALDQVMRALGAAGVDVGDAEALYLNRHWAAAFKSGDGGRVRRELLVLAAQPRPWASWFPRAGLLTAEMTEALRWPRTIVIVPPDGSGEADGAVLRELGLPVLEVRLEDAAGAAGALAQAMLSYLEIGPTSDRLAGVTECLSGGVLEGWIDGVTEGEVSGWCWRQGSDARQTVSLYVDGVQRASATADGFRDDLVSAGIGDGRHGFRFLVDPLWVGAMEVIVDGTGVRLRGDGNNARQFRLTGLEGRSSRLRD
jgi:hypothetical protein